MDVIDEYLWDCFPGTRGEWAGWRAACDRIRIYLNKQLGIWGDNVAKHRALREHYRIPDMAYKTIREVEESKDMYLAMRLATLLEDGTIGRRQREDRESGLTAWHCDKCADGVVRA